MCGVDSQVLLGAWGKGRSSAGRLNQVLRASLGWTILGRKDLKLFWVPTKQNPADDPSRNVPLRRPTAVPPHLEHLLRPERSIQKAGCRGPRRADALFLEVFAGSAGLTQAMKKKGFGTHTPYEAYPHRKTYVKEQDIEDDEVFADLKRQIGAGAFWYVHFGLPCSSWSAIQRLNKGTRRAHIPEGDGSLAREVRGNLLASRVAQLCQLQSKQGLFYSIENPKDSYVWAFQPVAELRTGAFDVCFDQCEYGLIPVHLPKTSKFRIKKPTRLLTNMPELKSLVKACSHTHPHFCCMGSVKTEDGWTSVAAAAGRYPLALCSAWANAAACATARSS